MRDVGINVSIVLVCGTEYARLDYVRSLLETAGVSDAVASKRDGMSPQQLTSKLLTVNKIDPQKPRVIKQLEIGRAWENAATELVLSNIESGDWGWSDPNLVYLLDFWRDFDPFTKFVIVYSSPERTVNAIIESGVHDEAEIERCLMRWRRHNTEYLRFYKNNKSRCILVDIEEVEKNGLALIDLANEREMAELETEIDIPEVDIEEPSSLIKLVTSSFVCSDDAIQSLRSEIERISDLPSFDEGRSPGTDDVNRQHNMMPFMDAGFNSGPSRTLALELLKQFQDMRQRELEQQVELEHVKTEAKKYEDLSFGVMSELHAVQEELEDTIIELGLTKSEALQLKNSAEQFELENAKLKSEAASLEKMTAALTSEKSKLSEKVDDLSKAASSLAKEQKVLISERDKLTNFNKELSVERDKLVGDFKALSGERDSLASQNEELASRLSGMNSRIASVTKEKDRLAQESAKAKDEIAQISARLAAASSGSNEVKTLQAELEKSAKDSELMLQQLHQVQSELEIYFNKYMELSASGGGAAVSQGEGETGGVSATRSNQGSDAPTEITVDFREFVEGENWYYAEHDGRWAGPDEVSTLNINSPPPGTYDIRFDVVDAMSPSIIANMKVFFDGEPISLKWRGKYATTIKPLRRILKNKVNYPLEMSGKVIVGAHGESENSQIRFEFPETISPLIHGGTDRRKLGIRLLSVRMTKV